MTPHVEKLPVPLNQLGEGPHWDSERQTLYYVDMPGRTLQKYLPSTKEHARSKVIDTDAMPSFIIPLVGHSDLFAVNLGLRVHVLRWDGQNDTTVEFVKVIAEFDSETPNNMINDGKVDPKGRLFTGTIGVENDAMPNDFTNLKTTNSGSFYSITSEGVVKKHYTGVTVSNGIVFDVKRRALYHNDTMSDVIRRLDYDLETGDTANKTDHFNFKKTNTPGYPDGMAGDTDGNLWVASYKGSGVIQINPETCQVLQIVKIPVHHVTSLTFGGPNLDVMFVTTALHGDPNGGGAYAVTGLGVKGYENLPFDFKGLKLK